MGEKCPAVGTLYNVYFHARRSSRGRWNSVIITGEVDLASLPSYRRALLDAVEEGAPVEIDLSECDLIDSTGLGVTVGAVRRVRDRDGEIRIVTSPRVHRLMERCRLDEILPLVRLEELCAEAAAPGSPSGDRRA